MALLFHGTIGEETVRTIFREGLRPSKHEGASETHWAHRLTGSPRDRLVFMSTSPVSGKGGDPVAFAMGFPGGRAANPSGEPGYLVVLDLPPEARSSVRALVPNGELDAYIELCWLKDFMSDRHRFGPVLQMVRSLFARRAAFDAGSLGRELELRLKRVDPELVVSGELSAGRWAAFVREYARLVDVRADDFASRADFDRERSKLLRRSGLQLPAHVEEDSHSRHCSLCVGALAQVTVGLRGEDVEVDLSLASPVGQRLALEGGLADLLRVVGGRFERPLPEAVDAYMRDRGASLSLDGFFEATPAEAWPALPSIWRPGYGRTFAPKDFLRPDHQVMAEAVEARYVLGAIALSSGGRLLPRFGKGRGRSGPLASQLWSLAHALRDAGGGAAAAASAASSHRRPQIV